MLLAYIDLRVAGIMSAHLKNKKRGRLNDSQDLSYCQPAITTVDRGEPQSLLDYP